MCFPIKRTLSILLALLLICGAALAYEDLLPGSKGEEVKKLQTRLTELGYYDRSIDGDYGSLSKTAVKAFQAANGLKQTGEATAEVLKLLYSADAKAAPPKPPVEVISLKKSGAALRITFKNNLDVPVNGFGYTFLEYSNSGHLYTDRNRDVENINEETFSLQFTETSTLQPGETLARRYVFENVDPRSCDVVYGGVSNYTLTDGTNISYTLSMMQFMGTDESYLHPLDESKPIILTAEEKKAVESFTLGMSKIKIDQRIASAYSTIPGIYILEVTPESLIDLAGLRKGDIITAYDDLKADAQLSTQRAKLKILDGETVTVSYWRNNKTHTVDLSLNMEAPVDQSTSAEGNTAVSIIDELMRCGDLLERGLITQEEYDLIKQKLLSE